jgi:hypothetical protein
MTIIEPNLHNLPPNLPPVHIVWNKFATLPVICDLQETLPPAEWDALIARAQAKPHSAFRLSEEVFIELPPPHWEGGDLLIYLPWQNWLVRRNKVSHWYVDMGVFRPVQDNLYTWTDLWLDVIAPEAGDRYQLLDADEFSHALRRGEMSVELAALALESLDRLVREFHARRFPLPEVREAVAFAERYRASQSR